MKSLKNVKIGIALKQVALASFLAIGSTNAFADRLIGFNIQLIYPNSSGNVDVWGSGSLGGNPTGSVGLTLLAADPGFKAMYAALLAARATGRVIEIDIVSMSNKKITGVIF